MAQDQTKQFLTWLNDQPAVKSKLAGASLDDIAAAGSQHGYNVSVSTLQAIIANHNKPHTTGEQGAMGWS
ncbi:Nif11 family protein [Chitinophaga sp. Mgbs1]|uniref:Nif11 family protein n=1 Tax=Chitinophaga solisilvae TaxID=1233460 RepID=A0A433WNH1_9BACT|nr:Nif11 family protein [Chitinophaga solisilvae]